MTTEESVERGERDMEAGRHGMLVREREVETQVCNLKWSGKNGLQLEDGI